VNTTPGFFPHLSVDCVLFGYDGEKLNVLLVEYGSELDTEKFSNQKLPGSVIYDNEDVDDAAQRVLQELTGIKNIYMKQFKCFANPDRTTNPRDRYWLENAIRQKIGRIITVGYLALIRIEKKGPLLSREHNASWCPLDQLQSLAFDHNQIINEALNQVRKEIETEPAVLFELLPKKFTAFEFRRLYEMIHGVKADVRNFHKKIAAMEYVVPLEERQSNVSHRAARYYRFDKKIYNKIHG
jgi:Uncharacterized conserved protein